jgi:hypothetical protein
VYAFETWTGTNLLSLSTEQRINFNFTLPTCMLTARKITDICSWQLRHVCSQTLMGNYFILHTAGSKNMAASPDYF